MEDAFNNAPTLQDEADAKLLAYTEDAAFLRGLQELRQRDSTARSPTVEKFLSYICGRLDSAAAQDLERYLTRHHSSRITFMRIGRLLDEIGQCPLVILQNALAGEPEAKASVEQTLRAIQSTPDETWTVAASWQTIVSERIQSTAAVRNLWLSKQWDEVRRLAVAGVGEAVNAVTQMRTHLENAQLASLNYGFASVRGAAAVDDARRLSSPDAIVVVEKANLNDDGRLEVWVALLPDPSNPAADLNGRSIVLLLGNASKSADLFPGFEDNGIGLAISRVEDGHARWSLSDFAEIAGEHSWANVAQDLRFEWLDETKSASASVVYAKFVDRDGREEATRPVRVRVWVQPAGQDDEELIVNFELPSIVASAIARHVLDIYLCVAPGNRQLLSSLVLGEMENGKASLTISSGLTDGSATAASLNPAGLFQLQLRAAEP